MFFADEAVRELSHSPAGQSVSAADRQPVPDLGDEPIGPLSVDALTSLLIPAESSASGKVPRQLLAQFLELDDASAGLPTYPTQSQIAERTQRARAQVSQILTKARERWRRTPALTTVRNDLAEFITAQGGVVEVGELAQFLLASRGSDADDPLALRRAAAVVRAALETEKLSESNRFEERRASGRFLISRSEPPFGEAALDYAEKLGSLAFQLASAEPLPAPVRVQEDPASGSLHTACIARRPIGPIVGSCGTGCGLAKARTLPQRAVVTRARPATADWASFKKRDSRMMLGKSHCAEPATTACNSSSMPAVASPEAAKGRRSGETRSPNCTADSSNAPRLISAIVSDRGAPGIRPSLKFDLQS